MSVTPGYIAFKMGTQISPIILTGGIAASVGGVLPIIALTESTTSLLSNAISGGIPSLSTVASFLNPQTGLSNALADASTHLDNFFAHYIPVSGSSLINNQIAHYPFANQQVAANAIIAQPLNISLRMICPANNLIGYPLKLATMTALQRSLYQHNSLGGLYSVVTVSYIYTNCIMTGMRDVSAGETRQDQYAWQIDFEQPLVTLQAAVQAENALMSAFTGGTPLAGNPVGAGGLAIGSPFNALTQTLAAGFTQ